MKTLLLLSLFAFQDVDDWIKKLGADEIEARDEAAKKLAEKGEEALPKLKEALKTAKDEHKLRIEAVVDRIERAALDKKIKIEIVLPAEAPTLKALKKGRDLLSLKFTNESDRDVVLFAYAPMSVKDADGKDVERNSNLGRWGGRAKSCFLEEQQGMFMTIPAGKSKEIDFGITSYMLDPGVITGWKLPKAGTYGLQIHLKFAKADFVRRCKCGAASHADAKSPWNQAVELDRTVEAKLEVKDP